MKAARFYDKGDIRVDDVEEPRPRDGQLVVDVEWCGICGSDVHEWLIGPVTLPTKEHPHPISGAHIPLTLGHELCGFVRSPPSGSKFKDGDKVFVDPRVLCKSCKPCTTGHSYACTKLGYVGGTTGFGGFGEKVLATEDSLRLLPPEIDLEYAAVIEPLAVVHHAVKVSEVTDWKDKTVLVLGGGPIGFALLLCLKAAGATNVIVSEPTEIRRKQVAEFCQTTLNPFEDDVAKRCKELTEGRGIDVVFDCAGVSKALQSAFGAMHFNALYIMVAVWEQPITMPCWPFLGKHITMKGTLIFGDDDITQVMSMMAEGKLEGYQKMVTGRIGLADIAKKGFDELVHNKDKHIKILVSPK